MNRTSLQPTNRFTINIKVRGRSKIKCTGHFKGRGIDGRACAEEMLKQQTRMGNESSYA